MTEPDVLVAARRLSGVVRRTEVLTSDRLDALLGARVFLKAEHRQYTGSFKLRGALNRMLSLTADDLAHGVIAGSSGNHGSALAAAASALRTTAMIVLPDDAPHVKRRAIEAEGGTVVPFDRMDVDRDVLTATLAAEHRRVLVPSSDHLDVVLGNGSAAVELFGQVANLNALVVPVGGGGLAAGSCLAARALCPGVDVFGAEPAGADDTYRSLRAGRRVSVPAIVTAADGLRHRSPGRVTFPILRRELRDVLLVSENDIVTAMRLVHRYLGEVVEPSGACALAAVSAHPEVFAGQRVGVLLSGGNVDRAVFGALTDLERTDVVDSLGS